jgi:membrane AbrB-like protein
MPLLKSVLIHLAQLVVATFGGFSFVWLGIPGGWLSGAAIAAILWGLTGFSPPMPRPLADVAMLISGASMGTAATPEALAAVARYPVSLLILLVGIAGISGASTLWLVRVSRWRRDDALLASVPGALSTVMAIAIDRNAAVASIAIVQNLRLMVLVALLPGVVVLAGQGGPATALLGQGLATLVSTLGHATGTLTGVIPPGLATAGLVLIGLFIADRFRNLDYATLPRTILAGLGSFSVGMAVAMIFAALAAWAAEVSFSNALVAFAPGGLEAMTVLALILGLDPIYVGIHHFVRFLSIGLLVPFAVARMQGNDPPAAS